jgi:hypothetical protein
LGTILVVAAVVAVVFVLGRGGDPPSTDVADPAEQQHLNEIESMLDTLASDLAASRTGAVAAEALPHIEDLDAAVPVGTVLRLDRASWLRTGAVASAVVDAQPPGEAPVSFLVMFVHSAEHGWQISQTFPQDEGEGP